MCGIFGYIGQSKHPKVTYALSTQLALKTEHRGKESTGIWGANGGENGHIIYHKEPINATDFTQGSMWRKLKGFDPNLLLVHCREPTAGASPKVNKNNHPHVSEDCTVALIHNGKVEEYLKYKYKFNSKLKSDCDSELLLHVLTTGEYVPKAEELKKKYEGLDEANTPRLWGVEEIYKKFDKSAFACAIGERHEGTKRSLLLYRNEKRPMCIIDLRASMGQVFFCSTMPIWREAVEATPEAKNIIPLDHVVIDFPVSYAYILTYDPSQIDQLDENGNICLGGWNNGWHNRKYRFQITREYGEEEPEIDLKDFKNTRPLRCVQVYTKLDSNDEVIQQPCLISNSATGNEDTVETVDDTDLVPDPSFPANEVVVSIVDKEEKTFDMDKMESIITSIKEELSEIYTNLHNEITEGNIKMSEFTQLSDDLEQIQADLISCKYSAFKKV